MAPVEETVHHAHLERRIADNRGCLGERHVAEVATDNLASRVGSGLLRDERINLDTDRAHRPRGSL